MLIRSTGVLVLMLLGLAVSATGAMAATYTVTTTADSSGGSCEPASCTLRQAVEAAGNGDTVEVPASASRYVLTEGEIVVEHGITIAGAGASSTVIDAQNASRVFVIFGFEGPVRLEGLTVTGGNGFDAGGGIFAVGAGELELTGVTVSGNSVTSESRGFDEGGGGIASYGSLRLRDSKVIANTATIGESEGDAGGGGIIVAEGDLTLEGSEVSDNTLDVTEWPSASTDNNGGGGLYLDGEDLTVKDSVVSGNRVTVTGATQYAPADGGGGIYQFGNTTTLINSTVADNEADVPTAPKDGGGGIFDDGDVSFYTNTTIAGNSTTVGPGGGAYGGGGVLFDGVSGGVVLSNDTIASNNASESTGGGIYVYGAGGTPTFLHDTIVAGNVAATGGDCSGSVVSQGYNLADDPSANSCGLSAAGDALVAQPGLGALRDNGGPVPTISLTSGSPAIEGGDPRGCRDAAGGPLNTDARGVSRPQPAEGRCDIGAYEAAPPAGTTGAAAVTGGSVLLYGEASNPDVQAGSVRFEYGTSAASYGHSTASQTLAAGAAFVPVSALTESLAPGVYHYRLVASSPDGQALGADRTFTVPAATTPPQPSVPSPSVHKPRPLPRALHVSVRSAKAGKSAYRFTTAGLLVPPSKVKRAEACRGLVSVRVKRGGHLIYTHLAKLRRTCRFKARVVLARRRVGRHPGQLRFSVRFTGNAVLAPRAHAPIRVRP